MRLHDFPQRLDVFADGQGRAGEDLEVAQRRVALRLTGGQCLAPDILRLLRQEEDRLPSLGDLGGQLDVLGAQRGDQDGNAFADRLIDQLQRLAQAGALLGRQRDRVVVALVLQLFAPPHLAADLDDLAGARDRRVVTDPVETLDHLRARSAQAQDVAAVGDVVQAGGGHGGQRGRAGVELQDARRQLDAVGAGCQVSERTHRVERIRLGDKDNVQAGAFEVGHLGGHLLEAARVVDSQSDSHAWLLPVLLGPGELVGQFDGFLLDSRKLCGHRFGQRLRTGERSHHHLKVVDQTVGIDVDEVAAVDRHAGGAHDAGLELQRVQTVSPSWISRT